MIQANELKIGNYVYDGNNISFKVYSINKTFCHADGFTRKVSMKGISPIPLTEEILLKCEIAGMKVNKYPNVVVNEHEYYKRYAFYNIVDGTSNLEIHVIESDYRYSKYKEFVLSIDNDERQHANISMLHKLQNAIYVATELELEVNI